MILRFFDITKFFDKERIVDAVLTCKRRGANSKSVRLWKILNSDTKIQVKTGVGLSPTGVVGDVVAQGTLSGALVSQAVLDDNVSAEFTPGGPDELTYGDVQLAPLLFQDDLFHGALQTEAARRGNEKMDKVIQKLGLEFNLNKTVYLLAGDKVSRAKTRIELMENPLSISSNIMKEKEVYKYLGQLLSSQGLSHSIALTIEARENKIKAASREAIKSVNDWRSRVTGSLQTAMVLWEYCCIPSLLSGAGSKRTLNKLQFNYLRKALEIGPGAPLASVLWECGVLERELRVWKEMVLLALDFAYRGCSTLAGSVFLAQQDNEYPGLAQEVRVICATLEDAGMTSMEKTEYIRLLKKALIKENIERILKMASGKDKMERILNEDYGRKNTSSKRTLLKPGCFTEPE